MNTECMLLRLVPLPAEWGALLPLFWATFYALLQRGVVAALLEVM